MRTLVLFYSHRPILKICRRVSDDVIAVCTHSCQLKSYKTLFVEHGRILSLEAAESKISLMKGPQQKYMTEVK